MCAYSYNARVFGNVQVAQAVGGGGFRRSADAHGGSWAQCSGFAKPYAVFGGGMRQLHKIAAHIVVVTFLTPYIVSLKKNAGLPLCLLPPALT